MEMLEEFGFDPTLFIAQIINFVIIFFVLKKLLYKPVSEMIAKRDKEIKKGLKDKEDAEILMQKTQEKETEVLQKAQIKAEKIINDAKMEANETKAQIEENAKKEADRILSQSRDTINQETKIAEDHLTNKIGTIAIGLLESSLQGVFSKKEQEIILKKAEEQLKKQKTL
jgi:F-type H+-transporting ATPase subunit b